MRKLFGTLLIVLAAAATTLGAGSFLITSGKLTTALDANGQAITNAPTINGGTYDLSLQQSGVELIKLQSGGKLAFFGGVPATQRAGNIADGLIALGLFDQFGVDPFIEPKRVLGAYRKVANADATMSTSDYVIAFSSLTASRKVLLTSALASSGHDLIVKDESGVAGTFNIVLQPNLGQLIDGQATARISNNYGTIKVYSDGTAWWIVNNPPTPAGNTGTVTSVSDSGEGITGLDVMIVNPTTTPTLQIEGTLVAPSGGTGIVTYSIGDILYADAPNHLATLAGNTGTQKRVLTSVGTGSATQAPVFQQLNFSGLGGGIAVTQMDNGTGATSTSRWGGDGHWHEQPITVGTVMSGTINWPGTVYSTPTTGTDDGSGNLVFTPTLNTQGAGTVFGNPSGTAAPIFMTPNQTRTAIGVGLVANGGTSLTSWSDTYALLAAGTTSTGAVQLINEGTATQVLTSNGPGALPSFQTLSGGGTVTSVGLTAGSGITVTGTSPITTSGSFAVAVDSSTVPILASSNTFGIGAKQTFRASGTTSGMRFGGVTAVPSGATEGDGWWYRTDTHRLQFEDNTTAQSAAWVSDFTTLGAVNVKPAVAVVATANLTLSGEQTIDGQLTAGSLVLATAQTTGSQNGPWLTASGAWTRPTWYSSGSTTLAPQFLTTFVRLGTTYQGTTWRMTTASVTIDTTATTWAETPLNLHASGLAGTLPAAQFPTLTGDVTTAGGALATTISNNAVSFGKMQNISTANILGRTTGGSGNVESLTALPWADTGDVTRSANGTAFTLATVNSNTGTFGDSTHYVTFTTNGKGLITAATQAVWPTFNQNTTGSAASMSISGQSGLLTFTGLTSTNRAKTVRDAADTLLELGGSYTPTGIWTGILLANPAIQAGSTSAGSWPTFASGSLLTTPVADTWEHDSTDGQMHFTPTTTEGRGQVRAYQKFYLSADGSAITTTTDNFFGSNSAMTLVANAHYSLKAHLYFTKTTNASVQFAVKNQNAYTNFTGSMDITPLAGDSASATKAGCWPVSKTASAGTFTATGTLVAANHVQEMYVDFEMGTGGKIEIQVTCNTGSVTPLRGSYFELTRLPSSNEGTYSSNF